MLGTMWHVKYSIVQTCAILFGACLLLAVAPADARAPWVRHGADRGGGAVRLQSGPALERILAQARARMSDAERERLRRDLSTTQRERGRSARRDPRALNRMTPQQRERLRRDLRDANRQLDRNRGRNGNRNGSGNGNRKPRRDRR